MMPIDTIFKFNLIAYLKACQRDYEKHDLRQVSEKIHLSYSLFLFLLRVLLNDTTKKFRLAPLLSWNFDPVNRQNI